VKIDKRRQKQKRVKQIYLNTVTV